MAKLNALTSSMRASPQTMTDPAWRLEDDAVLFMSGLASLPQRS